MDGKVASMIVLELNDSVLVLRNAPRSKLKPLKILGVLPKQKLRLGRLSKSVKKFLNALRISNTLAFHKFVRALNQIIFQSRF